MDTTVMTVTSHVRATPRAMDVKGSDRLKVCDVAVAMPMRPTFVSLPSASRSTSTRGVTVTSMREPPRSIRSVRGSSALVEMVSASSSHVSMG